MEGLTKNYHQLHIELPQELYNKLKGFHPNHGEISKLIRSLLRNHVNDKEDIKNGMNKYFKERNTIYV